LNNNLLIGFILIIVVTIIAMLYIGGVIALNNKQVTSDTNQSNQDITRNTIGANKTYNVGHTNDYVNLNMYDLTGTWHGTYTLKHNNSIAGEFEWIIYKRGENIYSGYMRSTGLFTIEDYIPIHIQVNGKQIIVETIENNTYTTITFNGTIEKDGVHASGIWSSIDNQNSGNWSAVKISSTTNYQCEINPPDNYRRVFQTIYNVLSEIFGSNNLLCINHELSHETYIVYFELTDYNKTKYQQYSSQLKQELNNRNFNITTYREFPTYIIIAGSYRLSENTTYIVSITITGNDQGYRLIIQITPYRE